MRRKHKKVSTTLNYIEDLSILASAVTGCLLIPFFASLFGISTVIMSFAIGLKICAMAG